MDTGNSTGARSSSRGSVACVETMLRVGADHLWVQDSSTPGPNVVLVHAGIADSRMWDALWPELTDECRVIRYDIRGYGRSPGPTEPYSLAGDLDAVLTGQQIDQATLVGCSVGGAAAVSYAVLAPRRVTSLVLLAPGIPGYPWPEEPDLDAEYERLITAEDDEGLVALALREWAAAGADPLVTEMMRSAVRAWRYEDEYQKRPEPVFDRLAEITAPTVVMVGDRDRPPMIACAEAAAERIPDCTLVRMPGVDHLPSVREPAWVAQVILESANRPSQSQ